jgi:hypothetical protein
MPPFAGCGYSVPAVPTPIMARPALPCMSTPAALPAPIVRVAAVETATTCSNAKLAHLLIEYHEACAAGDRAKARNLAAMCIALDPMCFSR